MLALSIYLILFLPVIIYVGILKEKSTLLTVRFKMATYIFVVPISTVLLCNIMEKHFESFFYNIWQISIPLCLLVYALIEEVLKFFLAPIMIKNKKQLKTVVVYTALIFALFETLLKYLGTLNLSNFLYRLISTTPLHLFLGFLFFLFYDFCNENKKTKYFIPLIINTIIHTIINIIAHYNLLNGMFLIILSIITTLLMIEFNQLTADKIREKIIEIRSI